jgi:hypothetical protein
MTEKNKKRLTMRQELRNAAEDKLIDITADAAEAVHAIALKHGVKLHDLVKAISEGSHKTAEHNLVTQIANNAERELIEIWNNQQKLDLGERNGDD